MVPFTKVILKITYLTEGEDMSGPINNMMVNGRIQKCMVRGCVVGLMEEDIKATTSKERNRVTECFFGPMGDALRDSGRMVNG